MDKVVDYDDGDACHCLICQRLHCNDKQTHLTNDLQYLQLLVQCCSTYLHTNVFFNFEWNLLLKLYSSLCPLCHSTVTKLFDLSKQLEKIQNSIQELVNNFTDAVTTHREERVQQNFRTEREYVKDEDIDVKEEWRSVSTNILNGLDVISDEDDSIDIDICATSRRSDCEIPEEVVSSSNIYKNYSFKSLKIVLTRLRDEDIRNLTRQNLNNQSNSKRKAAIAANEAISKVVRFQNKNRRGAVPMKNKEHILPERSDFRKGKSFSGRKRVEDSGLLKTKRINSENHSHGNSVQNYQVINRYKCSTCKVEFNFSNQLQTHLEKFGHVAKHMCKCFHLTCKNLFRRKIDANRHYYLKHYKKIMVSQKLSKRRLIRQALMYKKKIYTCQICKKQFSSKATFSHHRRLHKETASINCDVCQKRFAWRVSLNYHFSSTHQKDNYNCIICHKSINNYLSFQRHKLLHSRKIKMRNKPWKKYRCGVSVCRLRFYSSSSLKSHCKKSGHEMKKIEIKCRVCKKIFAKRRECEKHREVHKNQSHKCKSCHMTFRSKTGLLKHRPLHTKEKYDCKNCSMKFKWLSSFQEHFKIHKNENEHQCKICGVICKNKKMLDIHKESHSGELPYNCSTCLQSFQTVWDSNYHRRYCLDANRTDKVRNHLRKYPQQTDWKCDICDKVLKCPRRLKTHKDSHDGSKTLKCNICEFTTYNKSYLATHVQNMHSNPNNIQSNTCTKDCKCEICDKVLKSQMRLKSHKDSHDGNKTVKCNICEFTTYNKSYLAVHVQNVHTSNKEWKCDLCDKTFPKYGQLQRHKLTVHNEDRPFKCKECGSTFKVKGDLRVHSKRHLKESSYICPQCGKGYKTSQDLRKHSFSHLGKTFVCEHESCGKKFHHNFQLTKHVKMVHQNMILRLYPCEICGKNFKGRFQLNQHVRKAHTREKPFACSLCDKKFFLNSLLKEHERIHRGEFYKCDICKTDKTFTTKALLAIHQQIHKGKRFECKTCGKAFSRNDNLKTHMRSHTGEKPYQCQECGKNFTRLDNLNVHLRWHQKSKEETDDNESESENESTSESD